MKNLQKGSAVPVLLLIVVILVIAVIYLSVGKYANAPEISGKNVSTETGVANIPGQKVTNGTTNMVAKPVITVISPNGGETFRQGYTIAVKWSQNFDASYVTICLLGNSGCVYSSSPKNYGSGTNTFTIPAGINISSCNANTCHVSDGYKVRVTTDNQPGSDHAGEFMNDESDNYFVIFPIDDSLQARSFLQQLRLELGTKSEVEAFSGFRNIPGYRLSLSQSQFASVNNYLKSRFGGTGDPVGERTDKFDDWHIECTSNSLGIGAAASDLPYVWCADKTGIQNITVNVKDIKGVDTDTRTFLLTIGQETMKVRMPANVQNTDYKNGTFSDFVRTIENSEYQTYTFQMTGQLNGDEFDVIRIQWSLG